MAVIKKIETIYHYTIFYIIISSKKKLKKVAKKVAKMGIEDLADHLETMSGICFENKESQQSLIVINNYDGLSRLDVIAAIRHEVHHACASAYRCISHDTNVLDEEPFMYFNDSIFKTILSDFLDLSD